MEEISLEKLIDELAKTNRRIDQMQKTLDLLFADREILETIQGKITGLEEQVKLSRQHDISVKKDITHEVQMSGDRVKAAVETQVEEIKDIVAKKRLRLVKNTKFNLFNYLRGWRKK